MHAALLLPVLLLAQAAPLDFSVRAADEATLNVIISGTGNELPAGEFRGAIALYGSTSEVAVAGRVERPPSGGWRLWLVVRYAQIPADWADRFAPGGFDYVLSGRVGDLPPVVWKGTRRWSSVGIEGNRDVLERFVRLQTLEVTQMSLLGSEARAVVAVRNPFAFPLKIASARYRLWANGQEVGAGATRGMLLRPQRDNTLLLGIDLDHGALIAAGGRAVVSGGNVDARLRGELTVRLPRGDVTVPLDLAGALSLRP